jgi:hypothetical protein
MKKSIAAPCLSITGRFALAQPATEADPCRSTANNPDLAISDHTTAFKPDAIVRDANYFRYR